MSVLRYFFFVYIYIPSRVVDRRLKVGVFFCPLRNIQSKGMDGMSRREREKGASDIGLDWAELSFTKATNLTICKERKMQIDHYYLNPNHPPVNNE